MKKNNKISAWEKAVIQIKKDPHKKDLVLAAYYDDPLINAAERYFLSEEWLAIKRFLPKSTSKFALDAGAGRGISSYALAREGFIVSAIEPDSSIIVGAGAIKNLAHKTKLPITVIEEFSEKLPFSDQIFDVVFARAVLHHTKNLNEACREFFRVLKPDGILIAVREHVISNPNDLDAFFETHPLHKLYGGENAFQLSIYKNAIVSAGFKLNHVIGPLESSINLAPRTMSSFKKVLLNLLSSKTKIPFTFFNVCFKISFIWKTFLYILSFFDNRPGRLYSFIARRP
jgi:SAM-dependent methyltransferase